VGIFVTGAVMALTISLKFDAGSQPGPKGPVVNALRTGSARSYLAD
jgi:hypothetical protein